MIGVRTYVALLLWAIAFLAEDILPMKTIALVTLVFCAGAALHALLIRWGVWMFSRERLRIINLGPVGSQRLFRFALLAAGVWYFVSAVHDGRSTLNVLAIEATYLAGVWLYLHRAPLRRELVRRFWRVVRARLVAD